MTGTATTAGSRRLGRLLSSREDRADAPGLGPNWFASVMGTGILATAAATLPIAGDALHGFAVGAWLVASALLASLLVAVATSWIRRPHQLAGHLEDPTMAQFFGAPPMALMTVGAATLLVGPSVMPEPLALGIDWTLWSVGTVAGLLSAVVVPFLLFTRHEVRHDAAFGGWLMPVVPPMVSAATGALLIPHMNPGPGRETMLYGCLAMFGLSLVASFIIITLVWSRLAHHGTSGTVRVPTLWIVLGPLGQSITAIGLLARAAHGTVDEALARIMDAFSILVGVSVWGFAVLWIALASAITARTLSRGLPFALTWWSFTFPVGTFVTGTTQLALHTDLPAFSWAAVVAFAALGLAWITVAVRTTANAVRGDLLHPPVPPVPVGAKG